MNSVLFNITITSDTVSEGDEIFYLTIDKESLPDNVKANKITKSVVTIVDSSEYTVDYV